MVAYNPVLRGKWTLKKFNATVINDIWPEVLFFTAVATSNFVRAQVLRRSNVYYCAVVTFVSIKTPHSLAVNPQLLTVLGTVLGLVISFRTSSAYERFAVAPLYFSSLSNRCR